MAMAGGMPMGGLQAVMASNPNWRFNAASTGGMPTPAQARAAGVVGSTARPGTTAAAAPRPATPDQQALQQALMTGVAGFTPWQTQTQNQVWNFANKPLSPAYSQAATAARYGVQNPLGDYDTMARYQTLQAAQNPLGGYGSLAGGTARQLTGNPLGGMGQWATTQAQGVAADPMGQYDTQATTQIDRVAGGPLNGLSNQAQALISNAGWQPGGPGSGLSNSYLAGATSGQYLSPNSNPYLQQMVQQAQGDTANAFNTKTLPAIAAQFAASGQFGSDQQRKVMVDAAGELQKNLGQMATSAYGNAYSQERGLQQQAAGQLGAQGLQQSGMQLQAAGQLGNLGQAVDQSRLNAASQYAGLGAQADSTRLQAAGLGLNAGQAMDQSRLAGANLGLNTGQALDASRLASGQQMLGIGQAVNQAKMGAAAFGIDAANAQRQAQVQNFGLMGGVGDAQQNLNQRYADMLQSQWMQGQQMPWQTLQNYGNLVYGNPAAQATTQTQNNGGGGGGALGGALGGGLALYGLGSGYGWWGK